MIPHTSRRSSCGVRRRREVLRTTGVSLSWRRGAGFGGSLSAGSQLLPYIQDQPGLPAAPCDLRAGNRSAPSARRPHSRHLTTMAFEKHFDGSLAANACGNPNHVLVTPVADAIPGGRNEERPAGMYPAGLIQIVVAARWVSGDDASPSRLVRDLRQRGPASQARGRRCAPGRAKLRSSDSIRSGAVPQRRSRSRSCLPEYL